MTDPWTPEVSDWLMAVSSLWGRAVDEKKRRAMKRKR